MASITRCSISPSEEADMALQVSSKRARKSRPWPAAPYLVAPVNQFVINACGMSTLWQDVVYAVRGILRSPGYAAVTLLTLALGIGANTAIFSIVHGVLLRPLPYPAAEQLVFITSQFPALKFDKFWMSVPEYLEL